MMGRNKNQMKRYLAIFDLDGTLYDTRDVNYYAYKEALKTFGIEIEEGYFLKNCFGRHYKEFLPEIMDGDDDIERVHDLKTEAYQRNLDKARINRHLFQIIRLIKDEYYIAVVTTASRRNTMDIIHHFGHEAYFDYIATQENIERKKPDPEGFLMVMKYFGVDADKTIIYEDSEVGITAARATGAGVMIVDRF